MLYLITDFLLRPRGDLGVWLALLSSYVYRAGTLAGHLPKLFRSVPIDGADGPLAPSELRSKIQALDYPCSQRDCVEPI